MTNFENIMELMLPGLEGVDKPGVVVTKSGEQNFWKCRIRNGNYGLHRGFDFNLRQTSDPTKVSPNTFENPKVFAPVSGKVTIRFGGGYNTVEIVDSRNFKHQILHMSSFNPDWLAAIAAAKAAGKNSVTLNDPIAAGTQIGIIGAKAPPGVSVGVHVHYQVRNASGQQVDPVIYHNWGVGVSTMLDLEGLINEIPFGGTDLHDLFDQLKAQQDLFNKRNKFEGLLSKYLLPGADFVIDGLTFRPPSEPIP